jgi:hypothetical protein
LDSAASNLIEDLVMRGIILLNVQWGLKGLDRCIVFLNGVGVGRKSMMQETVAHEHDSHENAEHHQGAHEHSGHSH